MTGPDGSAYMVVLPPLRGAQKQPRIDPTELTE